MTQFSLLGTLQPGSNSREACNCCQYFLLGSILLSVFFLSSNFVSVFFLYFFGPTVIFLFLPSSFLRPSVIVLGRQ